jgi:hypothetical protein
LAKGLGQSVLWLALAAVGWLLVFSAYPEPSSRFATYAACASSLLFAGSLFKVLKDLSAPVAADRAYAMGRLMAINIATDRFSSDGYGYIRTAENYSEAAEEIAMNDFDAVFCGEGNKPSASSSNT